MSITNEEQQNSTVGYFPGRLGQTLDNGRWTIIRKLGWGPRSSTWLAVDSHNSDDIEAIKVFTVSASHDSTGPKEKDILQRLSDLRILNGVPVIRGHFFEESSKGRHLCLVLHALGNSMDSLRKQNVEGGYLPLHVVKKITSDIVEVLAELHDNKIVHGMIIPENVVFCGPQQASAIRAYIDGHPNAPTITDATNSVVSSQPLVEDVSWNATATDIANYSIYLSNFSYAQIGKNHGSGALFPSPELLKEGHIGPKTDVWMLGYTIYLLLTGTPLYTSDINAESLQTVVENLPTKLTKTLSEVPGFSSSDIPETVSFLTSCLRLDPDARPSADDLLSVSWVADGTVCSCGWCKDSHATR